MTTKSPTFKPGTQEELAQSHAERQPDEEPLEAGPRPWLRWRIADMGFDERELEDVSERVRELTLQDLEDFARLRAGIKVVNPRVSKLTIEEVQGLERLFQGLTHSAQVARPGRRGREEEASAAPAHLDTADA